MTHMKTWGRRLAQLLFYGGLEKGQYQLISPQINESNRKSLLILSTVCALFYFVRLNLGYSRLPDVNRFTYLAAVLLFCFIALCNYFCQNSRRVVHATAYLFLAVYLGVGILLLGIYTANMRISGIYSAYLNLRMDEIQKLNTELRRNREELHLDAAERANHAKTTFLNSMSHDIRTPMNAIIGFTALAQSHLDQPEQVEDYLGKIMTSSQHLLSLINDVLDMSRIESGKVKIEEKPLHLPDVLNDLHTITQPSVSAKQQTLSIDAKALRSEDVLADKLRLDQILLNILSNAIKFTPEGGTIRMQVVQKDTAPAGFADFEFRIQDTGIGMSQEFLEHIFEAFTREETAAVNLIPGTGLGMAITKNLVDMMHGTITVESAVGKGTRFTVALRFALAEKPAFSAEPVPLHRDLAGKHLLLAEDNALNQEIAVAILQENGFVVDTVSDGSAAVERLRCAGPGQYDVILMDVQMPQMNGYDATRAIRALDDPEKAHIPIIAMTANAFEEDRRAALETGMNAHVAKPIDILRLLEALQQIL